MKIFLLICSGILLLGLVHLPIGYYTFLRIAVTIGAVLVVVTEFRNGFNFWVIIFGLIAILFNPIFPVYLNDKSAWRVIDLIGAIIFAIKGISIKQKN